MHLSCTALFLASLLSSSLAHLGGRHERRYRGAGGQRRAEGLDFGYVGTQGPLGWTGLARENFECSTGTEQSPINFEATLQPITQKPQISFPRVESTTIVNNGHTLEVEMLEANATTTFNGKTFALQQFHFHTPSEHLFDGEYFPLEVHMVHEAQDKSLLVMGAFFDTKKDSTTELMNGVLKEVSALKTKDAEAKTGPLDFGPLVNHFQTTDVFTYAGSLTTPPCSSGVTWVFAKTPLPVDLDQFQSMKSIIKFNSRYVQNTLGQQNLIKVAADQIPTQTQTCQMTCMKKNGLSL